MDVAPLASWKRCYSTIQRAFGGNLDNKKLVAGTTLYLPVHVEGALFSYGDNHAAQGTARSTIALWKPPYRALSSSCFGRTCALPVSAETRTHILTFDMDPHFDRCVEKLFAT
jgi:hypothetical protein